MKKQFTNLWRRSSIPFGFYPQPETGSEITLRSTGKKEEVTTTCAKPNRGHAQSDRGGNDREGSGGVGTLNATFKD